MNTSANTNSLERRIVGASLSTAEVEELIHEDAAEIMAMLLELEKAQRLVDGVCNSADGALEEFDAETERMRDFPVVSEPQDVATAAAVTYGNADLGTRCMISGGEVVELDTHLEARYEELTDDGLPF